MSARIDEVLDAAVERGDVPMVVAMVADAEGVRYEGATGPRRADADDPVTPDSPMRIASMTKRRTGPGTPTSSAGRRSREPAEAHRHGRDPQPGLALLWLAQGKHDQALHGLRAV